MNIFRQRSFIIQGRINLTNLKCIFAIILGYAIGVLLSEIYNHFYMTQSIQQNTYNHLIHKINIGQRNYSSSNRKSVANDLYHKVKILCWIMTNPKNHKTKAAHVLKTWGKRCNKIILISSEQDEDIPEIVALPVKEGKLHIWPKVKKAFKYIYENYLDEYDWFLKADDDTYVIVENLRFLLYEYDPRTPIYFGYKFGVYVKQGYMSGGAGYVLSKASLQRFIEIALPNPLICFSGEGQFEDVKLGICLQSVGVIAGDSRDRDGRGRFFIFVPERHLIPSLFHSEYWYLNSTYYKTFDGLNCCSDYAISFHYVKQKLIYILDYLIYRAKPYGVVMKNRKLPSNIIYIERKLPDKRKLQYFFWNF